MESIHDSRLLNLPAHLLDTVLSMLLSSDSYSFGQFRLCSHNCNEASEPTFYRIIKFRDYDNSQAERDYGSVRMLKNSENCIRKIVARILSPEDRLRRLVRKLCIGPFRDDALPEDLLPTNIIVRLVKQFTNLRDFGWYRTCLIPQYLLDTLHSKATIRLHTQPIVFGAIRRELDLSLLSSPQLYSLSLGTRGSSRDDITPEMEFDMITTCISRLRSNKSESNDPKELPCLKFLRIFSVGRLIPIPDEGAKNFNVESDTIMPSLKGLFLPARYAGTSQHMAAWLAAADWNCLKSLTLGGSPNRAFLPSLTGKLTQLTRLVISEYSHSPENDEFLEKFVASITAIEELTLICLVTQDSQDYNRHKNDEFWLKIISLQGASLRVLKLCWQSTAQVGRENSMNRVGLGNKLVERLVISAPGLRSLELDCLLDKTYQNNEPFYSWPESTIKSLARLSRLHKLKLRLEMIDEANLVTSFAKYTDRALRPVRSSCNHLWESIFENFLAENATSPLSKVDIIFHGRRGYQRTLSWYYTLRRLWRFPGEKGPLFAVEVQQAGNPFDSGFPEVIRSLVE